MPLSLTSLMKTIQTLSCLSHASFIVDKHINSNIFLEQRFILSFLTQHTHKKKTAHELPRLDNNENCFFFFQTIFPIFSMMNISHIQHILKRNIHTVHMHEHRATWKMLWLCQRPSAMCRRKRAMWMWGEPMSSSIAYFLLLFFCCRASLFIPVTGSILIRLRSWVGEREGNENRSEGANTKGGKRRRKMDSWKIDV